MNDRDPQRPASDFRGFVDISPADFKKWCGNAIEYAEANILGTTGTEPMLLVYYRSITDDFQPSDIGVYAILIDSPAFNEPKTKFATMCQMGEFCFKERLIVVALFMVCEAWLSTRTDIRPSEDPERRECLIITGLSSDLEEQAIVSITVQRDDEKRMKEVARARCDKGGHVNLLHEFFRGYFSKFNKKEI